MIRLSQTLLAAATFVVCSATSVDLTLKPYAKGEDVVQATIDLINSKCIFPTDRLFLLRAAFVQSEFGEGTKTFRPGYYGGIWQIDENMFNSISACPGNLRDACQQLQTAFNITWQATHWSDLRKPIYSALALRLYMKFSNITEIPGDISDQAQTWAIVFKKPTEYAKFGNRVANIRLESCDKKMDVVFLTDSSGSIGTANFLIIKEFLQNVTEALTIHPDKTRVGLTRFSSQADILFQLNTFQTKAAVQSAIRNMSFVGAGTNTAEAIKRAHEEMFVSRSGSRVEAVSVMILVTDGMSGNRLATIKEAEKAKDKGIIVFAIGIGNANFFELNAVASIPKCTHLFFINRFDELDSLLSEIHKSACRAPRQVDITDGTANQTVEIPSNGTIEITEVVTQKENGTTVTTFVECGVVDVYISVNTPHPGPSFHDIKGTATVQMPSSLYVESSQDGRPLYITYIGKHLPADITQCVHPNFTINYVDGKVPETQIKCFQGSFEKPCTALDFDKVCNNPETTTPANPCTDESLERGIFYHTYPGDDSKFIRCDLEGGMYIILCPESEKYDKQTHGCGIARSDMPRDNGTTPLEYGIWNPCTLAAIQAHQYYFAYPDTHFYIQCDVWGNAWKVSCKAGQIWNNNIQACSSDNSLENGTTTPSPMIPNPCTSEMIANRLFYHPYPNSPHWFFQCTPDGIYFVQECAGNTVFNTQLRTCN